MRKEIFIWQLIVLGLGIFFILTVREYLQDKIEVQAETERAKCIALMKKTFEFEERFAPCEDIETYKLKAHN